MNALRIVVWNENIHESRGDAVVVRHLAEVPQYNWSSSGWIRTTDLTIMSRAL